MRFYFVLLTGFFLLLPITKLFPQTIPFQLGWPRTGSSTFGLYYNSPTIDDIDCDGNLDVSVIENIFVEFSGFPVEAEDVYIVKAFETSPTLVDIDNDGDLEIFSASLNKRVYGYDTPGFTTQNICSTFKSNPQRTAGKLIGWRPPNEVATLVNENKEPGNYEVTFSGLNLSSEMNIYKLVAGNFVSTKKMNLLR